MDRRRPSHLRLPCLCCEFVCGVQTSGEVPTQELLDTGDGTIGEVLFIRSAMIASTHGRMRSRGSKEW
jgi:hypothetical protein